MNRKYALLAVALALALSILACGTTPATDEPAVETQAPVEDPAGGDGLTITDAYAFTDSWGDYYVVGNLVNNLDTDVSYVELSIEMRDAAGNSLLKDDNDAVVESETFYPMLYNLAPGDSTPFSFWLSSDAGAFDNFVVRVTDYDTATLDRAQLLIQNVYTYADDSGSIYLSGELVNQSNGWAYINGVAGAMLNAAEQVVTADWTFTYATALAPAGDPDGFDRTPFSITMTNPGIEMPYWYVYYDAEIISEPDFYPVAVELTYNFFDGYDSFHIVGTVTNNSSEPLHILLVGGLYSADSLVIDADDLTLPVVLPPGETVPFDMYYFGSVNYNSDVAAILDSFTIQADWYNVYPSFYEVATLSVSNDSGEQDGDILTVTGTVTNDSGAALSGETVLVYVTDPDGVVVASGYTYLFPDGDSIAAGAALNFEVTVYLEPGIDYSDYLYTVIAQGDIK